MVPIRNVRRAIRPEIANKLGFVNWYQPDFHRSEKSLTIRNFYCCPTVAVVFNFYCFLIQIGKPKKKNEKKT